MTSLKKAVLLAVAVSMQLRSVAFAQSVVDPSLSVRQLVSGLSLPTTMAFIGVDDILVLQKNDGRVRRVRGGVLQAGEVLDVAVDNSSERGLLGIALHPQFPTAPYVYLYFTESSTGSDTSGSPTPLGNRVYRYAWDGSRLSSPMLILDLPVTPGPNHDGGVIIFGPDGKLYVVIGDLNRAGQLQNVPSGPAPDDTSVIFRLNEDGTTPGDNPFTGSLARYFAYGVRNSFGLAFDPVTEKLWMTENGPATYDEINRVEPGFNSGWGQIMGPDSRDPQGIGDLFMAPGAHYGDPQFSWFRTVGPTGLVFLRSLALGAQYENELFVGDINNGNLYRFRPNATRDGFVFQGAGLDDLVADDAAELQETIFGTGFGGITDLEVGPDGLLYVLSFSGSIYVVSRAGTGPILTASPVATAPEGTLTARWSGIAAPSATDWIGLYTPGAMDSAYQDWIYVSCSKTPATAQAMGSCPFALPTSLATGSYELRLFANNGFTRQATSNLFSVQRGPGLGVMPISAPAGSALTARWSGITAPTATDWIGLYSPGAADAAYQEWVYVSCSKTPAGALSWGSCAFVLPSAQAVGDYELRLFANNAFTRLAASNAFTVQAGTSLSAAPTNVSPGAAVTARWNGIATATATDWLGLYTPGAGDMAYQDWTYVSCTKTPGSPQPSGSCPFAMSPSLGRGSYELRLFRNNVFDRLAGSNPFVLTSLSVAPTNVTPGATLTARWDGIAAPTATDWIGLYNPGAREMAYQEWMYVSCSKTPGTAQAWGSCAFVLPASLAPGTYELRLLANNGYTRLAPSNTFSVN